MTTPGWTSVSCHVSKRAHQLPKKMAQRLASECRARRWTTRIRKSMRRRPCSLPEGLRSSDYDSGGVRRNTLYTW